MCRVIFVPSFQFHCEPKIALERITSLKKKSFSDFSVFSLFRVIEFLLYHFYFFPSACFRIYLIILLTFLKQKPRPRLSVSNINIQCYMFFFKHCFQLHPTNFMLCFISIQLKLFSDISLNSSLIRKFFKCFIISKIYFSY